jgi:hypothetical protein
MTPDHSLPPLPDELEISLFGAGYGEAIALHIGYGQWVLVDSYRQRDKEPDHLAYLNQLGVDVSRAVQSIVVTHWHDDHVKGISDVYDVCVSADLVISSALSYPEFLTLVNLPVPPGIKTSSGLQEFRQIFRTYQQRRQAHEHKKLHLATALLEDNASVFKVPHHGSGNAHNPHIWAQALCESPYALLTPYNRGKKPLPSLADRQRISHLTSRAFITATRKKRAKFKNRTTRRTLQETTRNVYLKEQQSSHIRLRCKLNHPGTKWQVHLFGGACALNELL